MIHKVFTHKGSHSYTHSITWYQTGIALCYPEKTLRRDVCWNPNYFVIKYEKWRFTRKPMVFSQPWSDLLILQKHHKAYKDLCCGYCSWMLLQKSPSLMEGINHYQMYFQNRLAICYRTHYRENIPPLYTKAVIHRLEFHGITLPDCFNLGMWERKVTWWSTL